MTGRGSDLRTATALSLVLLMAAIVAAAAVQLLRAATS